MTDGHPFESLVEKPNEADTCRVCHVPLGEHWSPPPGFRGINVVNEEPVAGDLPEPGGLPAPGRVIH